MDALRLSAMCDTECVDVSTLKEVLAQQVYLAMSLFCCDIEGQVQFELS